MLLSKVDRSATRNSSASAQAASGAFPHSGPAEVGRHLAALHLPAATLLVIVGVPALAVGVALVAVSLSRSYSLSVLLLLPVGFTLMVQMASTNTLIQMMIPDDLRGRIMSVYSMMFMGMAPLGALIGGTIAHRLGAPLAVALGGCGCLAAGLVFALRLPRWRQDAQVLYRSEEAARKVPQVLQ